jgi:hypothetical protein
MSNIVGAALLEPLAPVKVLGALASLLLCSVMLRAATRPAPSSNVPKVGYNGLLSRLVNMITNYFHYHEWAKEGYEKVRALTMAHSFFSSLRHRVRPRTTRN